MLLRFNDGTRESYPRIEFDEHYEGHMPNKPTPHRRHDEVCRFPSIARRLDFDIVNAKDGQTPNLNTPTRPRGAAGRADARHDGH
jgi:hypothetical protein